jgi:hypothetical protein
LIITMGARVIGPELAKASFAVKGGLFISLALKA